MKNLIIPVFALSLIAACSSTKNPPIAGYEGLKQISQDEVIMRSQNCKEAGMRPVVQYVSQQFSSQSVEVPVAVNCYPTGR
jgi:hypothetical protein